MTTRDTGEILLPGFMIMIKSVGTVKGPNGDYEILVDMNNQPVVRSMLTHRKFILSWANIVEIAVANGIDDKGEKV